MAYSSIPQAAPAGETISAAPAPRRDARMLAVAGALVALLAITVGLFLFNRGQAYAFNGGEYSPPLPAPALDLTDQHGNAFSLADHEGDVLLLYFGYTTCPDLCPTTLSDFGVVKEELGADAGRVQFALITIDPERDTPERLREYLAFFDPEFVGLRGDDDQTDAATRDYGVTVKRVDYPESAIGYLLDHTALVYVIDPEGRLRLTYPYGADPVLIAQDVRHLLNG
jgi:protein SCO1/2